ncbi:MAG: phosphatidate cytidylyltransferase [Akkermansiaceae bacterium]|nr:phosphatidate cytidylyltransferase [Akkermansiaceae bacterium]
MADSPSPPSQSKALVFARRSASTLFLWGLVTAIFLSHQSWGVLALIAALMLIATIEYFQMMRAADVKCFPRFGILLTGIYISYISYCFIIGDKNVPLNLDQFSIFAAIVGAFTLQLRYPIRGAEALVAVAVNLLGFVYIAFLFSFVARVTFIIPSKTEIAGIVNTSGAFALLWLLTVTKFTDMGAYIVGSMIGRHKMIPHVSPGKTWEGFGGALFFHSSQAVGSMLFSHSIFGFSKNGLT